MTKQTYVLNANGTPLSQLWKLKTMDAINAHFKTSGADRTAFKSRIGHDPCEGAR